MPDIVLEPTVDILAALGRGEAAGPGRGRVRGRDRASAENAAAKLAAKHVDLMVANDVSAPDAGFEVDTNRALLLEPTEAPTRPRCVTKEAAGRGSCSNGSRRCWVVRRRRVVHLALLDSFGRRRANQWRRSEVRE